MQRRRTGRERRRFERIKRVQLGPTYRQRSGDGWEVLQNSKSGRCEGHVDEVHTEPMLSFLSLAFGTGKAGASWRDEADD